MSLPVHVNVIWDPTVGTNFHTLWGPPPLPPPSPGTPIPSVEMITTQMWTAGFLLGQNKFTKKTFHKGVFMCTGAHDIGALIPDVTIPPTNVYYPIMWPFSSRKITFLASTVLMEKNPSSCAQIFPPIPMMTCGDPMGLPLAYPIANLLNNVTVGLSFMDFIMGYARVAVSMVIDRIFDWARIDKFFKNLDIKKLGAAASVADEIAIEVARKLGLAPSALAKNAVSALAGWGLTAAEGNPTLEMKVGGGLVPEIGVQVGGDGSEVAGLDVFGVPAGFTSGNMPSNDTIDVLF